MHTTGHTGNVASQFIYLCVQKMSQTPVWLTRLRKISLPDGMGTFGELKLTIKTLEPGLSIYSGNRMSSKKKKLTKVEIWWGKGQMSTAEWSKNIEYAIKYFSILESTAESYAQCGVHKGEPQGWVHQYKLIKPIKVLQINSGEFLDFNETEIMCREAFRHGVKAVYVNWSEQDQEFGFCKKIPELQYIGSKRCIKKDHWSSMYDALSTSRTGKKRLRPADLVSTFHRLKKKKKMKPN